VQYGCILLKTLAQMIMEDAFLSYGNRKEMSRNDDMPLIDVNE